MDDPSWQCSLPGPEHGGNWGFSVVPVTSPRRARWKCVLPTAGGTRHTGKCEAGPESLAMFGALPFPRASPGLGAEVPVLGLGVALGGWSRAAHRLALSPVCFQLSAVGRAEREMAIPLLDKAALVRTQCSRGQSSYSPRPAFKFSYVNFSFPIFLISEVLFYSFDIFYFLLIM